MTRTKLLAWILTMLLLLGSIPLPAIAEDEMQLYSIVAIEDETVWVHTSIGLVPFDKDGWQIGEALYPGMDCYAIGPDGHIFYSIDSDIFEMDRDGNEVDKWLTPMADFTKMLVNDTYILVMSEEEYGAIHRQNHVLKGGGVEGVKDIGFYDEESFLLLQEDGAPMLVRLECATLTDIDTHFVSTTQKIAHGAEDGIYLVGWKSVYFLDSFDGIESSYMMFSDINTLTDVRMHGQYLYMIADNHLFRRQKAEPNAEAKVLTIVGGLGGDVDPRFSKAIALFTQRHPEYTVTMTERPFDAQLKAAVMANEPGYDMFILDSASSVEFKLSGTLVDFSDNEVITSNLAQYMDMPFLWESDGCLYGIPIMVSPKGFKITRALLNEIGNTINSGWTWDDFFALKDVAKELGMPLVADDMSWQVMRRYYESCYCDYVAGQANYDTEIFRSLAQMWKGLSSEGMINYDPADSNNALLTYGYMPAAQADNGWVYLGMPMLEENIVTLIDMHAFYVNRYSEHADAAIEFLEIFSSPEVQFESQGGNRLFLSELESYKEYPLWQTFGIVPGEEQMEQWKHFLCTGALQGVNKEFDKGVKEVVTAYLADEITTDEFALEMQERADLMVGE